LIRAFPGPKLVVLQGSYTEGGWNSIGGQVDEATGGQLEGKLTTVFLEDTTPEFRKRFDLIPNGKDTVFIYEGFSPKARERHGGEAVAAGMPRGEAVYVYPSQLVPGSASSGEALAAWCQEYAQGKLQPLWQRGNFAGAEDL